MSVADLDRVLARRREDFRAATFIIGVTGGVAAGKSSLAGDLAARVVAWPDHPRVEVVGSDGFLRPNADLDAAGLTMRKGYPETYRADALAAALTAIRRGSTIFPGYSHTRYDVDPALARALDKPDVLIVEGLGLGGAPVDVLIYLEAAEADLETWYVARFMRLWEAGLTDPASFYARFAGLDRSRADDLARRVWREINLPNVREHIKPLRERADIIVVKGAEHDIQAVIQRGSA